MKNLFLAIFAVASFGSTAIVSKGGIKQDRVANHFPSYQIVEKILFSVGEGIITLSDRNQMERELKAGFFPPYSFLLRIFPRKTLLLNKKALLDFLIAQKIIDLSLSEADASPDKKQVEAILQHIRASSSMKVFKQKLKQNGLTLKELKTKISRSLMRDFFLNREFVSKIIISDSDINGHFFNVKGKNLFKIFEYEFSFLSFLQTKEGLKQAREAFDTLPVSFKNFSKQKGGSYEKHRLKSGEMSASMEKALKNLSVSRFSPLTSIGDRVYIFKLDWKTPVWTASEEQERQKIHKSLMKAELIKEFHKWLKEKKSRYSLSRL